MVKNEIRELVKEIKEITREVEEINRQFRKKIEQKKKEKTQELQKIRENIDKYPDRFSRYTKSMYYIMKNICMKTPINIEEIRQMVLSSPEVIELNEKIEQINKDIEIYKEEFQNNIQHFKIKISELRKKIRKTTITEEEREILICQIESLIKKIDENQYKITLNKKRQQIITIRKKIQRMIKDKVLNITHKNRENKLIETGILLENGETVYKGRFE